MVGLINRMHGVILLRAPARCSAPFSSLPHLQQQEFPRYFLPGAEPPANRHELGAPVRRARQLGLPPALMTNGMKATRDLLAELADAGLNDVALHVDVPQRRKGFTTLRGMAVPHCGCFGVFWSRPLSWLTVSEDLVFVLCSWALYRLAILPAPPP